MKDYQLLLLVVTLFVVTDTDRFNPLVYAAIGCAVVELVGTILLYRIHRRNS